MKAGRERIISELKKLIVGQEDVIHEVLLTLFVGGNSLIVHPPYDAELDVVRTTTAILDPHFERPGSGEDLVAFQRLVRKVPVADPVMRYALDVVRASRPKSQTAPDFVRKWVAFGGSV